MKLYVLDRRRVLVHFLETMVCTAMVASTLVETANGPPMVRDAEIAAVLETLFRDRAHAVVNGDAGALAGHYDLDSTYGKWALDREFRRARYIEAWSRARNTRFVGASARLRIDSAEIKGDTARIRLRQSAGFAYVYEADPHAPPNCFGIGTRHYVELVRKNGTWVVRRDWYTDPLDEDSVVDIVTPSLAPSSAPSQQAHAATSREDARTAHPARPPNEPGATASPGKHAGDHRPSKPRYNREMAVAYADRYCGFAWDEGNGGEYNSKYKDFTGLGGDCTNFVSQVLGDADAGGLPMDWTWHYTFSGPGAGASRAWAQAEALVDYLIGSGRGARIARGTYPDVSAPSQEFPSGRVGALRPGDIVGYEERGRIVHLAVVSGVDSHGYVVVNSHTADRYHVPWDLGWDRSTVYWLISIAE